MILVDSHILLGILGLNDFYVPEDMRAAIDAAPRRYFSVASLWELSLKYRNGRLQLSRPPIEIPDMAQSLELGALPITVAHAFAGVEQNVPTRDPFDRLLLGICSVENLHLMTLDRALMSHPLAWKPRSAK